LKEYYEKTLIWIALAGAATTYAAAPQLASELQTQAAQLKSQTVASSTSQASGAQSTTPAVLQPLPQQMQAANMTAQFLTRFHYKTLPLDDAMSEKIFDRYLKSLDPDKLFLPRPILISLLMRGQN